MSAPADITDQVERRSVFALNESKPQSSQNLFIGDRTLSCRSDADAQLIVFFPFSQTVRLSALILDAPESDRPTTLKLYVNRATLGFDELDDVEATQTLTLPESPWPCEVKLRFVKFQAVSSLHIFVEREDASTTSLSSVKFVGSVVAGTDMKNLKKQSEE